MKRALLMGSLLVVANAATTAAHSDRHCNVPLAEWQSREAVQQKVEAEGWKITRIKTDDGCYKISALNDQGDKYEAKIDPATLKVLKMSIEYKEPR